MKRLAEKQKKKKGGNVAQTVWRLAEPIASELGYAIWDVRFVKEGAYHYLRITIDKPDGVTIDDCEAMSRAINGPLDQLDPIDCEYCLEVCSPGVERELTRPEHFQSYLGEVLNVRLIRPLEDGRKELVAILHSVENNVLELETQDGEFFHIDKKDTASVRVNEEYMDIDEDDSDETEE
ncbi:MAG: ribosome maturation factor RimP [Oscillospiraceae bacterium]|nr:ribosome maturation factor RimP [Oscillospiraceae bacterium]